MAAHYFKKNKLLKTLNQHDPIQSPIASMPASRDDMVDACQNVPDNFFKNIDSDSCQCIPIINDDECQQFLLDGTFGKGVSDCNCFSETGAKIVPIYMPPNTSPNPLSNIQHIMDQINKGVPVPLQTNDNSDNLQLMSHFLLLMGDMKTYDSDGNLTDNKLLDLLRNELGDNLADQLINDYNNQVSGGDSIDLSNYLNNSGLMDFLNEEMVQKNPLFDNAKLPGHHFSVVGYEYDAETGLYTLELDMGFGGSNQPGGYTKITLDPNNPGLLDSLFDVRINGPVDFRVESCTCDQTDDCDDGDSESNCELICSECLGPGDCNSVNINLLTFPGADKNSTCKSLGYEDPAECVSPEPCYTLSENLLNSFFIP